MKIGVALETIAFPLIIIKSQDLKPEYLGSNYFSATSVIPINLINISVTVLLQASYNNMGAGEMFRCSEDWLLFCRTWVQFSAPTRQFTLSVTSVLEYPTPCIGLPRHQACKWCPDMHSSKMSTCIK